jgi:DNA polymerase-3 subunit epsilon
MIYRNNFVVFDLETGGLSPTKHAVVEVCFQSFDSDLKDGDEFVSLVKPYGEYEITPQALQANGLSIDQIMDGRDAKDVVSEIEDYLKLKKIGREKPVLCGHNIIRFDIPFLCELFSFYKKDFMSLVNKDFIIDTMWWGRVCWQESVNYQLGTCCENAGIVLMNAHRASTDTTANKGLVKFFIRSLRGDGVRREVSEVKRFRETFQF